MRRKFWLRPSGSVIVIAAAVFAAVLAWASGGRAASPNICITPSTATSNASCVTEIVAPHVLTAGGGDAVSITRFRNESGLGGATATHVVISASFSSAVTVKSISLFVNGSPASTSTCTSSPTSVSCPVGAIEGGGSAKLVVRFFATSALTVKGAADYGEGGSDSSPPRPNGSINDTQTSVDSLTVAGAGTAQGSCFDTSSATVGGATTTQSTSATVGQVDAGLGLPCTPASGGVDTTGTKPNGFVDIWFAEFMEITGNAFGTVTLDALFNVPKGFVLKELTGPNPALGTSWTEVPACVSGLPPSGDSCIFSKKNLSKGGVEWILHVLGSQSDPRYSG
ncbi:MAG TPA: hypothetical protein VFU26_12170 [Gaiellaceae bacterium]|nr:hypothetical protein [Gaiellaceae bacterium]